MADLLIAGGGDAGLCFVRPLHPVRPHAALLLLLLPLTLLVWRAAFLHLRFPEASFLQEALVHLQLFTRFFPTIAALHLQLLHAHLDVLDVL